MSWCFLIFLEEFVCAFLVILFGLWGFFSIAVFKSCIRGTFFII